MKNDKSLRVGGYSVLAVLLAVVLLAGINFLAASLPADISQIDISGNYLYTLSEQTEKLIKGLDRDVEIFWMVTSGNEDPKVELLLEKFDALSDRLTVTEVDPNVTPNFSSLFTDNEGEDLENSFAVVSGDRSQYIDYMDIFDIDYSHYYEDGKYDYSFAGEDVIAAGIDYVIREDMPVLYALSGHGEAELPSVYETTIKRDNIELKTFSFIENGEIPDDCDALLINAPMSDLSDEETAKLKAFLAGGGKLMLTTGASNDGSIAENIAEMMSGYGVTLNPGIVIESEEKYYGYQSPYYVIPEIITHDITAPVRDNGYTVMLPISQGITKDNELPEGIEVERLLLTSDRSFSKLNGFNMTTYEKEAGDIDGPFLLGVAVTDSNTGAQIVWISSKYITDYDANVRVAGANQEVFVNSINWMCDSASSIAIHNKDLGYNYLTIPSSMRNLLVVVLVGVIPVLYFLIGLVISLRRQRK